MNNYMTVNVPFEALRPGPIGKKIAVVDYDISNDCLYAYFSIYVKRTRDLLRIGRASGAVDGAGDLHPDLAERLCRKATTTAEHILNICIRAIDYCPPVDIQFGEFLRALITADSDLVPSDPWDYRGEIIKAFRLRRLRAKG
jgi:hypothetical protein